MWTCCVFIPHLRHCVTLRFKHLSFALFCDRTFIKLNAAEVRVFPHNRINDLLDEMRNKHPELHMLHNAATDGMAPLQREALEVLDEESYHL